MSRYEDDYDDEIRHDGIKYKSGYTQWIIDGSSFYPNPKTVKKLPSGFYNIKWCNRRDMHYLKKREILTEKLLTLPDKNFTSILNDIKQFWESQPKYKEYDYVYKRGILLYGVPGCGKTSLINLITKDLIENQQGIVINIRQSQDIMAFDEIMVTMREIESDRRIIVIIEDIDNFASDNDKEMQTKLLNILDGNMQCDNIVILATTNYPETLEERFSNRPSRFDRNYEIELPDATVREYYIRHKIKPEDLNKINLSEWVKKTDGFTLDHLKELVLSVFVLGYDLTKSLELLHGMMNNKRIKTKSGKKSIGFGG